MFPITAMHGNLRIPWNEKIMLGISNPMPTFFHCETKDVDLQAQQNILFRNTIPNIARSMEASRTTVITVQHLRVIDKYNEYINSLNMNFNDNLNRLAPWMESQLREAPFTTAHQKLLKLCCFLSLYVLIHAAITQAVIIKMKFRHFYYI